MSEDARIEALLRELLTEIREFRLEIRNRLNPTLAPVKTVLLSRDQGRRLRALRKGLDMNQAQFGKKIGRSAVGVSAWETGETAVPLTTLEMIAAACGVTLEWLLDGPARDR
jgi:DNA-binding XRE family transcriptional regulator